MSWQASGYVKGITHSTTDEAITRGEKLILLLLADYTNPETGIANPSIPRLAEEGLYEKRQVMRIVESLEKKGFIKVDRSGFHENNKYSIIGLPKVTKCHVAKKGSDIDSDILPSKMSPEPNTNIKPIKSSLSLFETESIFNKQSSGNKNTSPLKKKPCDPRHAPVRVAIIEKYSSANGGDLPAWNGKEAKRLSLFLDEHRDWAEEKVIRCVENRFLSEVNHAEDPFGWIGKLSKYAAGPVDKFGNPLNGAQNGTKQVSMLDTEREREIKYNKDRVNRV